jgi:hypothetical protein
MHDGEMLTLGASGMPGFFSITYRSIKSGEYPPSGACTCYMLQLENGGEIRNKPHEHLGHLVWGGGNIAEFLFMKEGKKGGYLAKDIALIENIVGVKRSVFPCRKGALCLSEDEANRQIQELLAKAKDKAKTKTK